MGSKNPTRAEHRAPIDLEHAASVGMHLRLDGVGECIVDDVVVGYPIESGADGLAPNREQLVTRIDVVRPCECIVLSLAELESKLESGDIERVPRDERDEELRVSWERDALL